MFIENIESSSIIANANLFCGGFSIVLLMLGASIFQDGAVGWYAVGWCTI